jgi:hypothetical protein
LLLQPEGDVQLYDELEPNFPPVPNEASPLSEDRVTPLSAEIETETRLPELWSNQVRQLLRKWEVYEAFAGVASVSNKLSEVAGFELRGFIELEERAFQALAARHTTAYIAPGTFEVESTSCGSQTRIATWWLLGGLLARALLRVARRATSETAQQNLSRVWSSSPRRWGPSCC